MKAVVLQSNYIPWKGYFDLVNSADVFVFYDDVQFTKNDWRNRNRIKTASGVKWLSIPAGRSLRRLISEVEIADEGWKAVHKRTISDAYCHAAYFEDCRGLLDAIFDDPVINLSAFNQHAIVRISRELGIRTEFMDSREFRLHGRRTERLVDLLSQLRADTYLSGPSGRNYLDESLFRDAGVRLEYFDYSGYEVYRQLHGAFVHEVTILDLLFNEGPEATRYMKSFSRPASLGVPMAASSPV
jgi:hypothetical protein